MGSSVLRTRRGRRTSQFPRRTAALQFVGLLLLSACATVDAGTEPAAVDDEPATSTQGGGSTSDEDEADATSDEDEVDVTIDEGESPSAEDAGKDGWVLYQAVYAGWEDVDLGLVRPDGSEAHRIEGSPGNRWHPDWSPDGTQIAYDYELPNGTAQIGVVSVDGSEDRAVTTCEGPCRGHSGPAWSPDGRLIGFEGWEGPTADLDVELCYIALLDVETEEVRRILEWPGCEQNQDSEDRDLSEGMRLSFSPDGERIVFMGEGPRGDWALFTARIDGSDVTQLTDWGEGARPHWSPDGEWIVYHSREEDGGPQTGVGLHVIRPDGSDARQLTAPESPAWDHYPRWLPDGSGIIFARCLDMSTCEARLIDPDGSNDRLLIKGIGRQTTHFMWQPSGEHR